MLRALVGGHYPDSTGEDRMSRTVTKVCEVPRAGSKEARALEVLLGIDLAPGHNGFLIGWAAGRAAARLPKGSRIVRVVVVGEITTPPEKT
jgi:hypothetical protein